MTTLRLLIILGVVLLASILGTASCATNKDMAPNITDGTVYWVWPQTTYDVGDVVVMADPHTSTTRLRRIVARTSDEVYIESDSIVVNKRMTTSVGHACLERRSSRMARIEHKSKWRSHLGVYSGQQRHKLQKTNSSTVPKNMCLSYATPSECIDSRWWGAVPEEMIYGKIIWSLCLFCNDDGY